MALHSGYKPDEHPNSTQLKHHSHLEIPDGCDVSAELSLDAHQLYSLSGGPLNVLTVEIITATVSFQMVLVFQLS